MRSLIASLAALVLAGCTSCRVTPQRAGVHVVPPSQPSETLGWPDGWMATCTDVDGLPRYGYGRTRLEAITNAR